MTKDRPAYISEHRKNNREKYLDYSRKAREKKRAIVNSYKDKPCMDCGVKYPPYVMDFDHRENKLFDISKMFSNVGLQKILEEIKKCDAVCSNCHRIRTFNRMNAAL